MVIIADYFLKGLGSLLLAGIKLLPVNLGNFTLADFSGHLNNLKPFLVNSFSMISFYFPVKLFFTLIGVMLVMELILFIFRTIKFSANFFRGSGG